MSDLRDARLERALRSAPDDRVQPAPAVRRAILEAAKAAVAPPAPLVWWRKWWAGMGGAQSRNAAFATVLLAGVITLMWRHEEVPPAGADRAAPTAAVPAAPATSAAKAEPSLPESSAPVAAAPAEKRAAPVRTPPPAAAVQAPSPPAVRDAGPPSAERQRADAPGSLAQPAPAAAPAAAAAETQAPVAPSAAPARARAQANASADTTASSPAWDVLRVERGNRTGSWSRAEAVSLSPLLQRATSRGGEETAVSDAIGLRLELLREGQAQGVLEVGSDWLRWQPAGGAASTRRDAALAAAVRGAVEALPQRP
jgi:hypothetical protein